jgi:indolepyruvate ferredoxin oxidoreductase
MSVSKDNNLQIVDANYRLDDRYVIQSGRVFLTGTQALVRILLQQKRIDIRDGINSAGFVTGYRGSPLGGVDMALWQAQDFLDEYNISFLPALNEDLAATAVLGTQQVESDPSKTVDGVFSMWYGKGPGVDRAGDAIKHGNAYGSSPKGGALVVAGDDHGCVSSSMSHQSDVAFMAWFMPTISPCNLAEYESFGLWGYALSRYSGMWVGFKAISETVESASSVAVSPLPTFNMPDDFETPPEGLHYRWPDYPGPQIEARMVPKVKAVLAFARANPIDKQIYKIKDARFGIISSGKAHSDLLEALSYVGLDEQRCRDLGIDIYKVGMVWPLETQGLSEFMVGKAEILVVEEKRGIIESQLKEFIYSHKGKRPDLIVGKFDENDNELITWTSELSPSYLAPILVKRLEGVFGDLGVATYLAAITHTGITAKDPGSVARKPYFCSGCPHNSSTKLPDGSEALAGIGCHFMANWMDKETSGLIQMGGEGINWVAKSPYLNKDHVFQNLGDGTYFHSGSMAIRQALATDVNITYKILFNDAVAMTGGQPVDGTLTVPAVAHQVRAEGVERIAIVTDEPEKYTDLSIFPKNISLNHRSELDTVQRELRDIKGVTVLIYDQACATEKRRKRKRGLYPDPAKRVFINSQVCEGCGDCSVQSNCLSVVPLETPFGRKRQIDQHSCNKDFSCVEGFCPSFVIVEGGELRKSKPKQPQELADHLKNLPKPNMSNLAKPFDILVSGVGGTGVVTIGAIITMAAHVEGKGASVLDFMGFAQKGGSVLSYVRLAANPQDLNQVRIDKGGADAVIACDLVVATSDKAISVLRHGKTQIVLNTTEIPTADYILNRDADMGADERAQLLKDAVDSDHVTELAANKLATSLMGDSIFANVMTLGLAWQKGLVPISLAAIEQAFRLNDVAVADNLQAFNWGRLLANDADLVGKLAGISRPAIDSLEDVISRRKKYLTAYQNKPYADKYISLITRVKEIDKKLSPEAQELTNAVADNAFKVMAYKDEYEIARLYCDDRFSQQIKENFDGKYKVSFYLAPPMLPLGKDTQGRPKKIKFGPWMMVIFKILKRLKGLRGTAIDPFTYGRDRQLEVSLRDDYIENVEKILLQVNNDNYAKAVELAKLPYEVRGFGIVKEKAIKTFYKQLELLANSMR